MSLLEFLKNQQFAYYKTIFIIFLVLAIMLCLFLLKFFYDNFNGAIKMATIISVILIVIIINISHNTYNDYVEKYSSKKTISSELGFDFPLLEPDRALVEGIMGFLNVNYIESNKINN